MSGCTIDFGEEDTVRRYGFENKTEHPNRIGLLVGKSSRVTGGYAAAAMTNDVRLLVSL